MGAGTTATGEFIRVLLVDDDEKLARLTARYLETHGLIVECAGNGEGAIRAVTRNVYDVVLLDLMLPGMNGIDVCRQLRGRSDVPILMLTARGEEADRVSGLDAGADDYVSKPFSSRELLARIRAHVRRMRGRSGPEPKVLEVGPLRLETAGMRVTMSGRTVNLTAYEFALLRALAERSGRVLSREQLLDLARGSGDEAFDRSIDVHISRVRQKVETDPRHPRLLKTVRGLGYTLVDEGDDRHAA
ncbi:MAG: response regulator transcription factor [Myxococcales bacterium]